MAWSQNPSRRVPSETNGFETAIETSPPPLSGPRGVCGLPGWVVSKTKVFETHRRKFPAGWRIAPVLDEHIGDRVTCLDSPPHGGLHQQQGSATRPPTPFATGLVAASRLRRGAYIHESLPPRGGSVGRNAQGSPHPPSKSGSDRGLSVGGACPSAAATLGGSKRELGEGYGSLRRRRLARGLRRPLASLDVAR